jgi:hypothetical protein
MGITLRRLLLLCLPRIDWAELRRPNTENPGPHRAGAEPPPLQCGRIEILVILRVLNLTEWEIGGAAPASHLL